MWLFKQTKFLKYYVYTIITVIGESGDRSLVVSLEINSTMYQGVLFAQPTSSHLRGKPTPNSSANLAANIERKENRIS